MFCVDSSTEMNDLATNIIQKGKQVLTFEFGKYSGTVKCVHCTLYIQQTSPNKTKKTNGTCGKFLNVKGRI